MQKNHTAQTHLLAQDCQTTYNQDFVTGFGDFLMVSSIVDEKNSVLVVSETLSHTIGSGTGNLGWLCTDAEANNSEFCRNNTDALPWNLNISSLLDVPAYGNDSDFINIDHCLATASSEQCEILLSVWLLVVVIICNIMKVVIFLHLVRQRHWCLLITVGDAIQNFLEHDDMTTTGAPLLDYSDVRKKRWFPSAAHTFHRRELIGLSFMRPYRSHPLWFCSASVGRWALTLAR